MKRKHNRIWSLVLAGVLTFTGTVPAAATEPESDVVPASEQQLTDEAPVSGQQPADEVSTPETLDAGFLYAELSEDGTTQNVIVKLDTEQTLDSAVLFSRTSQGTEETSAFQIIENYAAFHLPVSEEELSPV